MRNFLETYTIGCHLSSSGGIHKIFEQAEYLNINTLQCFTKNNRQWKIELFTDSEVEKFLLEKKKYKSIKYFVSHASYLINLISDKDDLLEKSLEALKSEIERCDQLKFDFVVVHPGSNQKKNPDYLDELAQKLIEAIKISKYVTVLIENSSGQGTAVPAKIEEVVALYKKVKKHTNYIGICLDTCHLFAAGYDISYPNIFKEIIDFVDDEIGIEAIKILHINNSKKVCGSNVDRHEHIEKGMIDKKCFEFILNHSYLKKIPKILETPWEPTETMDDYIQNFNALKKIIS